MPFIGNTPDVNFTSFAKQDLTGVTGSPAKRGFTLTHAVANANEIEVFVNNVRQEPTEAYGVSATTLTMTGDVETSDDFYIIYLGKALQTVVPPDGSVGTAKIADSAVSTAKIASSAVDLTSKVTGVLPVANGGTGTSINPPIFRIFKDGTSQTITDNANVKITFSNTSIDTDSIVDLTNNKVVITSATSGYWQLHFNYRMSHAPARRASIIYVNGAIVAYHEQGQYSSNTPLNPSSSCTTIVQLSSGDYLEAYVYNYYNGSTNKACIGDSGGIYTWFEGWRIR